MKTYLAQGCATYSKRHNNYAYNVPETYPVSGWVDWSCGLGANLDGWQNSFSLTDKLAEPVAKLFCKRFHCEKVKILQSGSAACDAAVRIARAWTGKKWVIWTGYHGCGNDFISCEKPGLGAVPSFGWKCLDLEDIIHTVKTQNDIAAVFIEPVQLEYSSDRIKQLKKIHSITKKFGVVLIFDEIITGMRFLKGSVANATGIRPNLIVAGKGIGNGYPISFVGGSAKIMEQNYFISNTHNANSASLISAHQILALTTDKDIKRLWKTGKSMLSQINEILPKEITLEGYPTRAEWKTTDIEKMTALWELMATRKHIIGRAWFLNFQHKNLFTFMQDLKWACDKIEKGYKAKGQTVNFSFQRN